MKKNAKLWGAAAVAVGAMLRGRKRAAPTSLTPLPTPRANAASLDAVAATPHHDPRCGIDPDSSQYLTERLRYQGIFHVNAGQASRHLGEVIITISKMMLDYGVSFIDPTTVYISAQGSIGRDTVIFPNVAIEGESRIGDGCIVRSGTRIPNSEIGRAVEIMDNCLITDSQIGDGPVIGPMAHLRGRAEIGQGVKIGNFVEVKKSKIGSRTKASHLTYLGDATIGNDTNIGAGTITCNYDGVRKHETTIGNGVRIGSDTMLVAPVTVGDGAATGAGSVVTKDVEPNKLVVGVSARAIRTVNEEN